MARSILKIDTRDDSAIEIPYPKAIIDEMCDNKPESHLTPKAASFSSVLGSDGKVYSVPWGIPYILWIDPVDDSIGFKDISSTLDESGSIRFDNSGDVRNNGGWYTYATAVGNSIYYSPAAADKILKLTINNDVTPSPHVTPSPPNAISAKLIAAIIIGIFAVVAYIVMAHSS